MEMMEEDEMKKGKEERWRAAGVDKRQKRERSTARCCLSRMGTWGSDASSSLGASDNSGCVCLKMA
jgi:hypothetical protein